MPKTDCFYKNGPKLNFLKKTIEEKIDKKITSHRAGRWGLCARTIEWLEENDFVADTSVVPFKSFRDSAIDSATYLVHNSLLIGSGTIVTPFADA